MKKIETEYNKYGWKIIVSKNDDGRTNIYLRSKGGYHKQRKPYYLSLNEDNLKQLKEMLKDIERQEKAK